VLDRAGITDIGDRLVGKCSGGQQQRLRFALALLSDPLLMVLDEPTTGMDVEGRRDFMPVYGVNQLAHAPLGHGTEFGWAAFANIVAWLAAFVIRSALLFRRDTKRV